MFTLSILDQSLLEKTAGEHGWEHIIRSNSKEVLVGSARHPAQALITASDIQSVKWSIQLSGELLQLEIARSFPELPYHTTQFFVQGHEQLGEVLHRAAMLATSLPNQAAETFAQQVDKELAEISDFDTEAKRLVKQRIGQDTFRLALLKYWGGACSVTGINLQEILRASHAKPWADCGNDQDRLNVFNGFILTANLDALFDRGLITFSDNGSLICSSLLGDKQRAALQLQDNLKLRWITAYHLPFLYWHRNHVFKN